MELQRGTLFIGDGMDGPWQQIADIPPGPEYSFGARWPEHTCAFGQTCRMPPEQRCVAECRLTQVE